LEKKNPSYKVTTDVKQFLKREKKINATEQEGEMHPKDGKKKNRRKKDK
jgi:hypothetical protein